MINKYKLWIIIVFIVGLLLASLFDINKRLNSKIIATFDTTTIYEEDFFEKELGDDDRNQLVSKKRNFAIHVERLLFEALVVEFEIDTSENVLFSFIEKKYGKHFVPNKEQEESMRLLYKALREVIEKKRGVKEVYDIYFVGTPFFGEIMPYENWLKSIKMYSNLAIIDALEKELTQQQKYSRISYKQDYIIDTIERAYCNQNKVVAQIVDKLPNRRFRDRAAAIKRAVENKCKQVYFPWLYKQAMERVKVLDKKYEGYEVYLSFYSIMKYLERKL